MSGKTLFLSPAFIVTESIFVVVAAFAAYELLVGDFIWAQQEEARRTSAQSRRDRGYDSLGGRQLQMHGHRSLSPGGRGRGQRPPSRRGSNEEVPLLYSSRSRGDARVSEEGYYSSPGDTRYASPGRGSSGDSTRRLFYKVVLLALLSRLILLPVETFYYDDHAASSNVIPNPMLLQIILRITHTLPDIIFSSALGLLIIFCAQIAFAAMPPVTPPSNEGSVHGDGDTAATLEEGADNSLVGDGSMNQQESVDTGNRVKRISKKARHCCTSMARLSRTILASEKTFAVFNTILAVCYALVFIAALAVPQAPHSTVEVSLWSFLAAIHSFLLLSLIYVSVLLGRALHPGIVRRKSKDSLAFRLIGTCTMIAIMLLDRVVCFSIQANDSVVDFHWQSSDHEEQIPLSSYRRSTIEHAILEALPILVILFLMHRKQKEELHNDVLIIHSLNSIMSSLFGSTAQLDSTTTPEAGNTAARAGGLGSRRFQTYGGTRVDSFPPTSGKARRSKNIPRAISSSGRGRDPETTAGAAKPSAK